VQVCRKVVRCRRRSDDRLGEGVVDTSAAADKGCASDGPGDGDGVGGDANGM
jgi:hypothetical protein